MGYIFQDKALPSPIIGSTAEKAVRRIVKLISNFVNYSNPTPYVEEFGFEWIPLQQDNNFYIDFGSDIIPSYNPEPERMKFWQTMLELDRRNAKMDYLKIY